MRTGILCTGLCLLLLAPGAGSSGAEGPAPANPPAAGAPVLFDRQELFRLYDKLGPLAPDARARAVMDRLERLAMRPFFDPDSITIIAGELHTDIAAGDLILMTVTDGDAQALGKPRAEIATDYARRLRRALEARLATPEHLLLGLLLTAIATAALILLWTFVFRRGFEKLLAKIESWHGTTIRSLRIQRLEVLPAEHIRAAPKPFVLQTALNDFYVSYEVNAYTDRPNRMAEIYSELHQRIQDKFNEAGVEIMSPHYTQLRDGNRTTIPEPYLPEDYEPPAIRVAQVVEAARVPRPADRSAGERSRER